MKIKEQLQEYKQDPFFKTLFLIAVIIGSLLLFLTLADYFHLLGKGIGSNLFQWLH